MTVQASANNSTAADAAGFIPASAGRLCCLNDEKVLSPALHSVCYFKTRPEWHLLSSILSPPFRGDPDGPGADCKSAARFTPSSAGPTMTLRVGRSAVLTVRYFRTEPGPVSTEAILSPRPLTDATPC